MLNSVIRYSLRQPLLILALAALVLIAGGIESAKLPVDVFPDLNRPRVVIMTEAPGKSPEYIETNINMPLEAAFNGATGVETVRSSAGVGLSIIFVEFEWGTDLYIDRQIVAERLAVVSDQLEEGIQPKMGPVASIMGQVMVLGMYVDDQAEYAEGEEPTSLLELRDLGDWVVGRRLKKLRGVSQVFSMGGEQGGKRETQVLLNPDSLRDYGVTIHQVEEALRQSNDNATGGYIDQGPNRLLVRSLGRIKSIEDLNNLVIDGTRQSPVLLHQLAEVREGPSIAFGIASLGVKEVSQDENASRDSSPPSEASPPTRARPAVMLVVSKQPGADTRVLCEDIVDALEELNLPSDVRLIPDVYRMDSFIDRAIDNVIEALRDGGILVVVVLFIFLMNFRTTFITLTAIPLSLFVTVLVFRWFGMSINTMTLGGLAVAIGELVDDAIVDVENIYRRLRENKLLKKPRSALRVIYQASVEVRSSIVFATMLVVLVFMPLFALGGMEGKLFRPLGLAYIVSILASLLVSLTVTPVMSYLLLPKAKFMKREKEGPVLRGMQWLCGKVISWSLNNAWPVLIMVGGVAMLSVLVVCSMGRNFLPEFNEGTIQLSIFLPEGTSLTEADQVMQQVDQALLNIEDVQSIGRRTGRAEDDEHVHGISFSETLIEFREDSTLSRKERLEEIRLALDSVPGMGRDSGRPTTDQPISHLISHMLSGVKAQIAIRIYGTDLATLRQLAARAEELIKPTPGVVDAQVEPQVLVPQLQIIPNRARLAQVGLLPGEVNHVVETAMNGQVVSRVIKGDASYDLVVRLEDRCRQDIDVLRQLPLQLPDGRTVPLAEVADVLPFRMGPNAISRENGSRSIVVQCNTTGARALSDVRAEIEERLAPLIEEMKALQGEDSSAYHVEYGGQFESEQAATRLISMLSLVSMAGIFLILYSLFHSANLALQVMAALPMAAIGAVTALIVTGQNLSVPSMVGFISLAGIASRNGILLIAHYIHLVRHEGEGFTHEMVIRAGKERVAPVLMTALTSGIGLVPLAIAGGEPGKEILYPVATVIIGGLLSSTFLDFFVHPALFWVFGRRSAEQLIAARSESSRDLVDDLSQTTGQDDLTEPREDETLGDFPAPQAISEDLKEEAKMQNKLPPPTES